MKSGFRWESGKSPAIFIKGAQRYEIAITQAVIRTLRSRQSAVQSWMRTYAKWNDYTGRARRGLMAHVAFDTRLNMFIFFEFLNTVPYGLELELKNSGEYAVIRPTMDYWSDILWGEIRALFKE